MLLDLKKLSKYLREKRGNSTLFNVSVKTDISRSTLSRIENGGMPDTLTYLKICKYLEVEHSCFYFKTEDSTEDSSKQYIFDLIKAERARQEEKHGEGNRGSSNFRYLTITTEELGEVAKALLDGESTERIIEELVQVAAVCVQWIEKLKGGDNGH